MVHISLFAKKQKQGLRLGIFFDFENSVIWRISKHARDLCTGTKTLRGRRTGLSKNGSLEIGFNISGAQVMGVSVSTAVVQSIHAFTRKIFWGNVDET